MFTRLYFVYFLFLVVHCQEREQPTKDKGLHNEHFRQFFKDNAIEHYSTLFEGNISFEKALTFKVPGRSIECVHETLQKFDSVTISMESPDGNKFSSMFIKYLDGPEIVRQRDVSESRFREIINSTGDYSFCFENTKTSRQLTGHVMLEIKQLSNIKKFHKDNHDNENATMYHLYDAIFQVKTDISNMMSAIRHSRRVERHDYDLMEEKAWSILFRSILLIITIVGSSFAQVYYVQKMFVETKPRRPFRSGDERSGEVYPILGKSNGSAVGTSLTIMKAVYIAYSKCGTKTMDVVFKTLGYKCYDFDSTATHHMEEWTKILNEGATAEDFKQMYNNVDATVDHPPSYFWEEILEAFPDVKLLVHYREEEAWMKSFINQMEQVHKDWKFKVLTMISPTAQRFIRFARLLGGHVWGADRDAWPWEFVTGINYNLMRHRYRKHNLYIQKKAPKNQLHVVDFSKGWEPICKFLGEPVPDIDFPHANKAGEIWEKYRTQSPLFLQMQKEASISFSVLIVAFSMGIFYVNKLLFW